MRLPRHIITLRVYGHHHARTYVASDHIEDHSERKRESEIVSVVCDKLKCGEARIVRRIITPSEPKETSAARNSSGSFVSEQVVIVPLARTSVISSTLN